MKNKILGSARTLMLAALCLSFSSCEEIVNEIEKQIEDIGSKYVSDAGGTGIDHDKEVESVKSIPKDLSLVTLSDAAMEMQDRVVLTDYVPPVRSQGRYGTCTAWATGYYARTIMYAREHDLSPADLEDDSNVFSPLDIYLSISHGDNCGGSWPGSAMKVMQERGIATLATAPYENLGDCSQGPKPSWTAEAANYKIESYRTVDHLSAEDVKSYIQKGQPVQISCILGLDFAYKNDGEVMYEDDYSAPPEEHGRHAMCCVGFDDNKGRNGAFLVVNSWGDNWGDAGYFWADYDYFTRGEDNDGLVTYAYVIEGDKGELSKDMADEGVINPNYRVEGKDLMAIKLEDNLNEDPAYPDDDRYITYNVFNRGKSAVPASDDWNIVYYYYNAYDPENDFGILIYDFYTDDVGPGYEGQFGDFADIDGNLEAFGDRNYWNYFDTPSGMSVATASMNDGSEYNFEFGYALPDDLDGDYYFVLYADGFNDIQEQYEQNNFMFFTGKDRKPVKIENGVVVESSLKSFGKRNASPVELKEDNPNAYTIDEIKGLIEYQKREGILEDKANEFLKSAKADRETRGKRIVRVN
ncbi:C1 family peptidase [Marinilabilia sp.]